MKVALKTKWLEKLRSGEYKQGKYCLRDYKDEFCCLGVLCDIINPDEWVKQHNEEEHRPRFMFRGQMEIIDLPMAVEIGLPEDVRRVAVRMNDNGKTFAEIADYLESNLPDGIPDRKVNTFV